MFYKVSLFTYLHINDKKFITKIYGQMQLELWIQICDIDMYTQTQYLGWDTVRENMF